MPMKPHATKQDYELAFKGLHYPISKSGVVNMGRDKGGLDREVARVLTELPGSRYRSEAELRDAVREVYRRKGVAEEDMPV